MISVDTLYAVLTIDFIYVVIFVLSPSSGIFCEGVAGFQPKKKGSYVIEVLQDGRQVTGSPFKVEVGEGQLCHAGKVRVSGASHSATANKWNELNINIAEAGACAHTCRRPRARTHKN
jgi:hypothetical protein